MRQPARAVCLSSARAVAYAVIVAALCLAGHARADDRSDARAHYQAGVKFYGGGDYQGAIREFSAAQQLVPADLNNYNLALCYDKLGDAEPAIQYYRAFLDRQPGTDKRAEVEASIARLEAAQRSAAGKRAQTQTQADDARRAEEAKRADAAAAPLPPAGGGVAGALPAPGDPAAGSGSPGAPSSAAPRDDRRRPGPAVAGSLGTPGSASAAPTGDPQLDRANAINIDEIRDERAGVLGGSAERRAAGPAVAAADGPAPGGSPQQAPGQPALAPNAQPGGPGEPKAEAPLYKKWWFWAVVGVSAYVAYELVTSDSNSSTVRGRTQPQSALSTPRSGLTLLRW